MSPSRGRRTRTLGGPEIPEEGRSLLYLRAARRAVASGGLSLAALRPLNERLVFVFGCPRSGTTFLAGAIGAVAGFVDLGEVHPLKSAIPELATLPPEVGAGRVAHVLRVTRRLGLVGDRRGVEQTPETAFVLPAVAGAFPEAQLIHLVRDGRDVVCSLLERGWLSRGQGGGDDAGAAYGPHARFWVEPGRAREFTEVSDARRAGWAWRRYVSSVRESGVPYHELRYEEVVSDPEGTAAVLSGLIDAPRSALAAALREGHTGSIGRWRTELSAEQVADVEDEAAALLETYGYLESARG